MRPITVHYQSNRVLVVHRPSVLQDFQKSEDKLSAKMEEAKRAEIAQLQQHHGQATKKKDQQIKALSDTKSIIEKRLEQVSLQLDKVTDLCIAAGKDTSIATWIRELENDSVSGPLQCLVFAWHVLMNAHPPCAFLCRRVMVH